jgi:hypothetical protein
VNGRGLISLLSANGGVIALNGVVVDGIKISSTANGAISLSGTVGVFWIDNSSFMSISSGNSGGALYLNVTSFENDEDSVIENSNFGICSATNGGAIYIALSPIYFFNINFTGNTAVNSGNDIFFNATSSQTFYTSSTFQFCCSYSDGTLFALSDGSNLDNLLPSCGSLQGERYVSSSNSYDQMNNCLNSNSPCRSIVSALARGLEAGDEVVMISVIGEYDDVASSVGSNLFVHLRSESDENQGWSTFFFVVVFFFAFYFSKYQI